MFPAMKTIDLERKFTRPFMIVFGLALVVLAGVADYLTGIEMTAFLFYLIPVSFVSWFGGKKTGIVFSILCAVLWFIFNKIEVQTYLYHFLHIWNATVRGVIFFIIVLLVAKQKKIFETERRRAENELWMSEEKFKLVFDSTPDALVISDLNGKIIECNPATLEMFGYSLKDELIGKHVLDLLAPGDSNKAIEDRAMLLKEDFSKEAEYDHLTKDGRIFPGEVSRGVIHDSSGNPHLFVAIIKDITDRKAAEDTLAASKAYTESIIQNFLDTLIVVDAESKIQTVNPATCHLLGYTEEELKGQPVSMIFAEEEEEEEVKRLFQFFREPEKAETLRPQDTIRNRELTYKTKDGQFIPMLFNASTLNDEAGDVTGVVAGAKDITEIKRAGEVLRKTEEKFRTVIENIFKFVPEGLVVLTDKLNLFRHNKAFEDLVQHYAVKLNYSEEELADMLIEQIKTNLVTGEKSEIRINRKHK